MKLFKSLFVLFALILWGCSSNNTPEGVAADFAKAVHQCDFKKALKYCSKNSKGTMEKQMAMFEEMQKAYPIEITRPGVSVVSCEIAEDNMSASVSVSVKNSSIIQKRDNEAIEITINLVKEDGKWMAEFDGR